MKFTVLGMGKTGHTVCAYLLQQGQTVTAWDRDAQKLAVLEQSGIRVSGALEGHFPIHTESSLADAVADSKYILVMTTADGHKPVAERLRAEVREVHLGRFHGILLLAARRRTVLFSRRVP